MQVNRRKLITAAVIFLGFLLAAYLISINKPKPERQKEQTKPVLQVESKIIKARPYNLKIESFGTVRPRTKSLLVAQVSGQILEVNPAFRDGGYFNKNDILIQIDNRDYLSAVKIAQANLLQAELALEEEKAQANQAKRDWVRIGNGETAPDLVLRKPQLAAAEATVLSAQANLEQAQLNLDRTQVKAPYDGRILSTKVDLGQFVNSGGELANIFATDVVEIRLPLKNSELGLMDLPEDYRGQLDFDKQLPEVTIHNALGRNIATQPEQWYGKIVRTEAALDDSSYQLYVIAQIQEPFAVANRDKAPLKIGQYVTATIEGKHMTDALVIPTRSIYQGSYVYSLESNNLIKRRNIELAFQTADEAVVASGIEDGMEIITSPLGQVSSGTKVNSINLPSKTASAAIAEERK